MRIKRHLSSILAASLVFLSCGDDPARPPGGNSTNNGGTTPTVVRDLTIEYDSGLGAAVLTWTAPRGPGGSSRVARYDIWYSYSLPLNTDLAVKIADPPTPAAPGSPERYEIAAPLRGRDLYAVIQSYDDEGNPSLASGIAHEYIGGHQFSAQCVDAWTSSPLPDLDVVVTSRRVHEDVTDASGRTLFADVAGGMMNVSVRGSGATAYHLIDDAFEINDDVSVLYKMIEYRPTDLAFEAILQTFLAAINFYATGPVFKKWKNVPVPVYIPTYENDLGTVYDSLAVAAVERWEARTGVDLFVLVDTIPDVGVDMQFLPRSAMGIHNGKTERTNDSRGYPLRDTVKIVNTYSPQSNLYQVFIHELGHTIRLEHLPHPRYIMYASVLPPDISDDEVLVVQLHAALPNSIDLSIYDPTPPSQ